MEKNIKFIGKSVRKMGGSMKLISKKRKAYRIKYEDKSFLIVRKFVIKKSLIAPTGSAKFKDLTEALLKEEKIKSPKGVTIDRKDNKKTIDQKLSRLKFPIIMKDSRGTLSRNLFLEVENRKEALGILKANKGIARFMVQELKIGEEYRVLMLDGKVIAAYKRIPPFVVGNGKNKVFELIEKDRKKIDAEELELPKKRKLKSILKKQEESFKTIPKKGKMVFLNRQQELYGYCYRVDVTDKVHPRIEKICAEAASIAGLTLAGIDLICSDIEKEKASKDYVVLEVNGKPDLYIHYDPYITGEERDVVKDIVKHITGKII